MCPLPNRNPGKDTRYGQCVLLRSGMGLTRGRGTEILIDRGVLVAAQKWGGGGEATEWTRTTKFRA